MFIKRKPRSPSKYYSKLNRGMAQKMLEVIKQIKAEEQEQEQKQREEQGEKRDDK